MVRRISSIRYQIFKILENRRHGNVFEKHSRISPALFPRSFVTLEGIYLEQGAQILRIPKDSKITNLALKGGASYKSNWAGLRGAVLKFVSFREKPAIIEGAGFIIPSGYTLMDEESFEFTKEINKAKHIPHQEIHQLSKEQLYLVHASYCHPEELFLPQGTYTASEFSRARIMGKKHKDFDLERRMLFLEERALDEVLKTRSKERSFNILKEILNELEYSIRSLWPQKIIIQLKEGGQVILN